MADFKLSDYEIPLKSPVVSLHYDLSLWCSELLSIHPFIFPESLSELQKEIKSYAEQRPLKPTDKLPLRVYIIDQRLAIPFVAIDEKGKLATACNSFAHYGHRPSDSIMGNSDTFISMADVETGYDKDKVNHFVRTYDISPIEVLSVPSLLVFVGDKLDDVRPLSTWQLCAIMNRFRRENLVDWNVWSKAVDTYLY